MSYNHDDQTPIPSIRKKVISLGFCLGVLFWIIDSVFMALFLQEGGIMMHLFQPAPHVIWHRFWVLLLILGFTFHSDHMLHKHGRADRALKASEKKYRNLVELSPNAIGIQSEDKVIYFNAAGAKLFGVESPEQLVGQSVWDFVPDEQQKVVKKRYQMMRKKGERAPLIEIEFERADGVLIDAEVTAVPFTYDGKPAIQAIFRDVTERKRAESELVKLRKAVERSSEVIFLTDRDGLITYTNPAFTQLYGYSASEVVGQVTPRILKSGMMTKQDYEVFWETLLNKQNVNGELINRCQDGQLVTIEASANPILDEQNNIVGFVAIQHDITERKQAEKEIRQRNKKLAAFNSIVTTVNQSLDLNQILNDALDKVLWLDVLGDTSKGVIFLLDEITGRLSLAAHRGASTDLLCLQNPPQVGECLCGLVVQHGQPILSENCWEDERHTRRWQNMEYHKDICLPLKVRKKILGVMSFQLPMSRQVSDGDVRFLTAVADQISVAIENARLFTAVNKQRKRLHKLSIRLAETEEAERHRLANELHDQVGQKLTALGINLNIIRSLLPENGTNVTFSRLDESLGFVEQITEQIRSVMSDLRPPMLDDCGLIAALRWYGEQMCSRTGITISVNSKERIPALATFVETTLFRIAQEALTNVTKHAQATEVIITVAVVDNLLRLVIADNGIGFDPVAPSTASGDRGFGLLVMSERAEAVNGRCWIESQPDGKGTQVIAEVPL